MYDDREALVAPRHHPENAADPPPSEFRCPGCGKPLYITLHSDFCLAEAQIYCPACERDYQERRGRWAPDAGE